jgi:transposase
MKRIGLDTSAIDYCLRNNISASELKQFLQAQNLIPVICPYVNYEMSRRFLGNITGGKTSFLFISELEPQYIAPRETLYLREFDKIDKNHVFYDLDDYLQRTVVEWHSAGRITAKLARHIRKKQASLNKLGEILKPSEEEKKKIEKYKNFSECTEYLFLELKERNIKVKECIQEIISKGTNNTVHLSDEHILKFAHNIPGHKMFRSLIRNAFHLHFLMHTFSNKPADNRFTDGLIIIEYSYCDQFLSNDRKLLETHAQAINPDILPVKASEFLKDLVHIPNQIT